MSFNKKNVWLKIKLPQKRKKNNETANSMGLCEKVKSYKLDSWFVFQKNCYFPGWKLPKQSQPVGGLPSGQLWQVLTFELLDIVLDLWHKRKQVFSFTQFFILNDGICSIFDILTVDSINRILQKDHLRKYKQLWTKVGHI